MPFWLKFLLLYTTCVNGMQIRGIVLKCILLKWDWQMFSVLKHSIGTSCPLNRSRTMTILQNEYAWKRVKYEFMMRFFIFWASLFSRRLFMVYLSSHRSSPLFILFTEEYSLSHNIFHLCCDWQPSDDENLLYNVRTFR